MARIEIPDDFHEHLLSVFAARIRSARVRQHLAPGEFAEACGVSEATVYAWEGGRCLPRIAQYGLLRERFAVNPAWLLGLDGGRK